MRKNYIARVILVTMATGWGTTNAQTPYFGLGQPQGDIVPVYVVAIFDEERMVESFRTSVMEYLPIMRREADKWMARMKAEGGSLNLHLEFRVPNVETLDMKLLF